jgi:hypothetical protein
MSTTPPALPVVDPKVVAPKLHGQIGALIGQVGSTDWSVLKFLAEALRTLNPPPSDPTGACRYQLPNGTPVCAQMTQSECTSIGGSFTAGGSC